MAAVVTPKPLLAVQISSGFIDIADRCTGVGSFEGEKTFVISESALVSGVQTQLDDRVTVVNGTLAAFAPPAETAPPAVPIPELRYVDTYSNR